MEILCRESLCAIRLNFAYFHMRPRKILKTRLAEVEKETAMNSPNIYFTGRGINLAKCFIVSQMAPWSKLSNFCFDNP